MRTIRQGVFETNSSSCHSVTIYNKSAFDNFKNNDYILIDSGIEISCDDDGGEQSAKIIPNEKVISVEEFVEKYKDEIKEFDINQSHNYSYGELEDLRTIISNWNPNFISWVFSIKKYDDFDKYNKMEEEGKLDSSYEYRLLLEEYFDIDALSFNSLYCEGLRDEDIKKFKSDSGDEIMLVDTYISC